jgi:hypothetical protein
VLPLLASFLLSFGVKAPPVPPAPTAHIHGRVSTSPLAGARILLGRSARPAIVLTSTVTNRRGSFSFNVHRLGWYVVKREGCRLTDLVRLANNETANIALACNSRR